MRSSFPENEPANSLMQAALDTLPLNIALLNTEGEILATNSAWQQFATANDLAMQPDTIGVNYLDVCDQADDETADEAAAGIRDVIAGDRSVFILEYPCHSPDEQRWFILRATQFSHNGIRYISVVHVDITERKQAKLEAERTARQLSDERETLALLNQIVRHDIRNDANAIAGWATLLGDALDSEVQSELNRIKTAANHMTELTHTAADLTHTITNERAATLQPINLTEKLNFELEKLQTAGENPPKQIKIERRNVPDTDVWVRADEMLTSVFSNVLNNAVFHTHTAPVKITITVDRDTTTDTVDVRIADNGPGIPDSAKETVFGRGEKGLESDGTGLGLYLVDQLMERYGGEVWITDNTPTGTIVHLSFPAVNSPTAE